MVVINKIAIKMMFEVVSCPMSVCACVQNADWPFVRLLLLVLLNPCLATFKECRLSGGYRYGKEHHTHCELQLTMPGVMDGGDVRSQQD